MNQLGPDKIRVFEISSWNGPVEVDLPVSWALALSAVQVVFEHRDVLGWHASVCSGDALLLDFAWDDHVDRVLLENPDRLPTTAPDEEWSDLDQCWWACILRMGDELLIAETDFDALLETGHSTPELISPGIVSVGGTEMLWHRVGVSEYDAAWRAARQWIHERT